MKKYRILIGLLVLVSVVATFAIAYAGKGNTAATTNMIVGRPAKGMYCADPVKWLSDGIYVWSNGTPIKAQVYDKNGILITPANGVTWKVTATGQTGSMTLADSTNKIYTATPTSMGALVSGDKDYEIQYTADGKTFTGVVRRWNSDCDGCHAAPPAHAITYKATTAGTSRCRECHDLADKMKRSHASRINDDTSNACYKCHPSPCYGGVHKNKFANDSIGCVTCHGKLSDAVNGNMKIKAQLGLPRCENCHTSAAKQPVPYSQNTNKEFKDSVGHGRTSARGAKNLCIVCHNSTHMETKPMDWGDGVNNNCEKCHTVQPTANNMGDVCGNCHVSSTNPHIVEK
ncbi:MAG: hypothetical protein HY755_03745 [Nitrospirae bacterium]|nr:hypothetical protein [Nitrospirota bacterium]